MPLMLWLHQSWTWFYSCNPWASYRFQQQLTHYRPNCWSILSRLPSQLQLIRASEAWSNRSRRIPRPQCSNRSSQQADIGIHSRNLYSGFSSTCSPTLNRSNTKVWPESWTLSVICAKPSWDCSVLGESIGFSNLSHS